MAQVENYLKQLEKNNSLISDHVFSTELQEAFSKHWHGCTDFKDTNIEIISKPFRICRISNFLKTEEFLEKVKNELLDIKFKRNVKELFQFEQTVDFKSIDGKHIKMLYETFETKLTSWMELNTKIKLNGKISMSSSSYYDTDYLLCHDDNVGDRRIAYILYLTKEWSIEDGGALDLFNTDKYGLPAHIVKSLVPEYNSFVFFEVVDNSYHQVAEVTSREKCRKSINGWFHGPLRNRRKPRRPVLTTNFIEPDSTKMKLDSWISATYLDPDIGKQIQNRVETESYTFLQSFFKHDAYEKILLDLQSRDICWRMVGPADERRYETADEQTLPQSLKDICNIFKSISFFELLKDYTELDLVPENETMEPKMTMELQRWSRGCYTVIVDEKTTGEIISSSVEEESTTSQANDETCQTNELDTILEKFSENSEDTLEHATPSNENKDKLDVDNEESCEKCLKKRPSSRSSDSEIPPKIAKREDSSFRAFSDSCSDVEDYASHYSNCSESSCDLEQQFVSELGTLDVIMQFHTANTTELDNTIDYVDPNEIAGEILHIPAKDNHLCLVYKESNISRVHRYINRHCKGYFYNLICTYHE